MPETLKDYLLARLTERSTWLGLIGFVVAAGWSISPELRETIATLGATLASLVVMLTRDQPKPQTLEIVSNVSVDTAEQMVPLSVMLAPTGTRLAP